MPNSVVCGLPGEQGEQGGNKDFDEKPNDLLFFIFLV